jgi:hypothetical protein
LELAELKSISISGSLLYGGSSGNGDSVLLVRTEAPVAYIRIILGHDARHEVLAPIPAHRDVIYV